VGALQDGISIATGAAACMGDHTGIAIHKTYWFESTPCFTKARNQIVQMDVQHRGDLNHEEGALKEGIDNTIGAAAHVGDKAQEYGGIAVDKTKEVASRSQHVKATIKY